jgi:hypothetical protein
MAGDSGVGRTPALDPTVVAALLRHALCVDCIARKAALEPHKVRFCLDQIGKTMTIASKHARCEMCAEERILFRLA